MIVCLCHRVSDRDIRRAVCAGARSFEVLQDDTRVASSCACRYDRARDVFDAARGCCEAGDAQPTGLQADRA
jgi:bacterioferritin-associated ferredoxin